MDHFENICSCVNRLPSDSDFALSEANGLSWDLGNLMQSDASCASIPVERGSQSSNAQQQAVTPGLSFSGLKRRRGYGPEGREVLTGGQHRIELTILIMLTTQKTALAVSSSSLL